MNIDHLTTGSLESRLSDINKKFAEMRTNINNSLCLSCLKLKIPRLHLSAVEYRDTSKLLTQYFTIADIEYCEANRGIISTLGFNMRMNINSIPLDHSNNARVQFLSHVDKQGGFMVEIYIS